MKLTCEIKERLKRFISLPQPKSNDCILWDKELTKDGYGHIQLTYNSKKYHFRAHRLIYMLSNNIDNLLPDQIIRHTCDNPKCINVKHLLLGTHEDNVKDRVERNRSAKGIKNGQYIDGRTEIYKTRIRKPNPIFKGYIPKNSLLSQDNAKLLKNIITSKMFSLKDISVLFKVPYQLVRDISAGRSYINI
jgi:hypothetical protein